MKTTLPKDIDEIFEQYEIFADLDVDAKHRAIPYAKSEILKTHIPKSELLQLIAESKPSRSWHSDERCNSKLCFCGSTLRNKTIDLFEQNLLNKLEEK